MSLKYEQTEFFIDNLLVIIEMIWWTGLALWEFEFPFPGSLASTFLGPAPRKALRGVFHLIRRHNQVYNALTNFPFN